MNTPSIKTQSAMPDSFINTFSKEDIELLKKKSARGVPIGEFLDMIRQIANTSPTTSENPSSPTA